MLLQDKTALVTGAATGIGEAIARLFAAQGARVLLLDRDAEGVETVAASLRASGQSAAAFAGDVRHAADIRPVVDAAVLAPGRLDILVNNAGIYPRQTFLDMTEEQWDQMHDINLKSMFHSMQLALPHMVKQGYGKIVNISSVTFHLGMDKLTHYVASKGGVIGLTRSLAREMGPHNIHINCITPGAIQTAAEARVVTPEQAREMMAHQSLQRRIMPLDVARVCLFLSSDLSDGMTGQCLNVDGGWVMY